MPSRRLPPPDASLLDPLILHWPAGQRFHRVHAARWAANEFNPGYGQGRFHPFNDLDGQPVPTLYGSDQVDGALTETVFRGIPAVGTLRGIRRRSLINIVLSILAPKRELKLADLRGHGLRRLGLQRNQLLETEAEHYAQTAAWGAALHHSAVKPDGLIWVSRQFDTAAALLLFGDRVRPETLKIAEPPVSLYRGRGFQQVLASAERADLVIVD